MKVIKEYEAKEMYDDFLDEIYGQVNIAGYEYSTAYALKEIDPVAYEEDFRNFADSLLEQGIAVAGYTDEQVAEVKAEENSEMGM